MAGGVSAAAPKDAERGRERHSGRITRWSHRQRRRHGLLTPPPEPTPRVACTAPRVPCLRALLVSGPGARSLPASADPATCDAGTAALGCAITTIGQQRTGATATTRLRRRPVAPPAAGRLPRGEKLNAMRHIPAPSAAS